MAADRGRNGKARWVNRVLSTTLTGDTPAEMRLTFKLDKAAPKALEIELFGKRLLVTDHDAWTPKEVVAGYRSQNDVESGFRQLKDPHVVGFYPMFHWTDSKIRVHVFYCVLALAVAHLMRREAARAGLRLSVRELLDNLSGIEETILLYPPATKADPAHNASSPTPLPLDSACPTCSDSTPTPPDADMGNTPQPSPHPADLQVYNSSPRKPGRSR